MTANYYLGVDIGNTKSHALISDEAGKVVGFAKAGHGNHEQLGFEGYARVIQNLIMDVLQKSTLEPGNLSGSGFGIAGYDWPSQYTPLMNAIRAFELGRVFKRFVDDFFSGKEWARFSGAVTYGYDVVEVLSTELLNAL